MKNPPIRTVEDFLKAGEEWTGCEYIINGSDNAEEVKRAETAQLEVEYRMKEARSLFTFDAEGVPVSLNVEALIARYDELTAALRGHADAEYVRGIQMAGHKTECLGWEWKALNGKYGKPEHDAHEQMNKHFGAHFGIYTVLKEHWAKHFDKEVPLPPPPAPPQGDPYCRPDDKGHIACPTCRAAQTEDPAFPAFTDLTQASQFMEAVLAAYDRTTSKGMDGPWPAEIRCAIGGSVLHKGRSEKDLDVFVYPHDADKTLTPEEILGALDAPLNGLCAGRCNPDYLPRDCKEVYWSYNGDNRRIDFFFLK